MQENLRIVIFQIRKEKIINQKVEVIIVRVGIENFTLCITYNNSPIIYCFGGTCIQYIYIDAFASTYNEFQKQNRHWFSVSNILSH